MKSITLLLEQDEVMTLRMLARMMQLMTPESNEQLDRFVNKILDATNDLNPEWRKEIGKMQRALRKIKTTPEYAEFQVKMKVIEKMMVKEMQKEE